MICQSVSISASVVKVSTIREEDSDMHTVRLGIENTGCPMLIRIILRDVRLVLLSE